MKILVTGASGFLGTRLVRRLLAQGADVVTWDRRYDLRCPFDVEMRLRTDRPTHVYHLAGFNGGIQFNLERPAEVFHDNVLMALNLLEGCRRHGVEKVLGAVASCAYGDRQEHPEDFASYDRQGLYDPSEHGILVEDDFLRGRPHPATACHGYAKRALQLACCYYRRQYGLKAVCVCPTTLYGPGDSFDPERTKLVGAMVKRFVDAAQMGARSVTCWGSGRALREFLYVEDCARLLIECMQKYDDSDLPLNLGTGQELSVRDLACEVARVVGYEGGIHWDESRSDGQLRKRLDLSRMQSVLGEVSFTPLDVGLARTACDYLRRSYAGGES